uniref:Anaphase-promoting complex subunit 2 n=1 Tax=Kwoniella dejecticola CBS 10117 TaxID=1296121 RepID=A0A1A5ZTE4_9TREE|nr:anaphase-promoting complex subunit 2 [Kwoniella dejecticola CBS 10117]OBR81082.1 anaphase-promoting complex subunit 2 [Kwoniella dejecticola CBS 10117]
MALVAALTDWNLPSTSAQGARQYEQLAHALKIARDYLHPRNVTLSRSAVKPNAVEARFPLITRDVQRYIEKLSLIEAEDEGQMSSTMSELLERIAVWQRAWGVPLRAFQDPKLIGTFTTTFHSLLHSLLSPLFPEHLLTFLTISLESLPKHLLDPPQIPQLFQSVPVNYHKVHPPSPHLSRLGIFPRYSGTLSKVAYKEIEKIAREEAGKGWDSRRLTRARQRVGDGVANWLSGMFEGNEAAQAALRPMFSRFDYYLCKCFFDIRTDELFDIIVDFPDSMAALEDLKECLFKVDQRLELVNKLNAAILKRLLHPGAETKLVLSLYISTIRSLRILDPPGVLLHKVASPIRKHLRDRPDTIKCIVATLVEGEELGDENETAGLIKDGEGDDQIEDWSDPKWDPEPVDAAPEFRSGKAGDIVSTLVSIYQTREVIIKALQVLLATRLLAVKDYDAVKEIRTIELLKLRFGEQALHVCDVMLKDMADSKRIDDHVQGDIKSSVHPLVISKMFWPNIPGTSLVLPPKLLKAQAEYEAAFHQFKPDKHLRFLHSLGEVHLSIELEDRVVEVEANPIQASIIELFEQKNVWTLAELRESLQVTEALLKDGLEWWRDKGVLKDLGKASGWKLLEVAEGEEA